MSQIDESAQPCAADSTPELAATRCCGETPRKNYRIVIFAQNSRTDYSGGRYHSWMMAEALAHAGHRVQYVTNNLPIFYSDFLSFPHHRDLQVCLLKELGRERLNQETGGDLQLEPTPHAQLLAESRRSAINEQTLGQEQLTFPSAASRGPAEADSSGPYAGTYGASVEVASVSGDPGDSRWSLKISSAGAERSGINDPSMRIPLKGGRRYLISGDILCNQAKTGFRLGVKSDVSGNLWAVNPVTNTISFANQAGRWTTLSGILTLPAGEHPSQIWIMHWEQEAIQWHLDNVSLREILDEKLPGETDSACAGEEMAESSMADPELTRWRQLQDQYLMICRPFLPGKLSDSLPFTYYYVDPERPDWTSLLAITAEYPHVFIEQPLAEALEAQGHAVPDHVRSVPGLTGAAKEGVRPARLLCLASNDTHVHYMMQVAKHFKDSLFVIPKPSCKEEGAAGRLREHGIPFVEIDYKDRQSPAIESFAPDLVLSGADWTSEFLAVHAIAARMGVPCIALQEGPQDWDQKIKDVDPRKYRNAEILFSQGSVTLKYIRPKYFAVTGNPKTDHIDPKPMPARPRLFINCNFTYGQYEEHRQQWMTDILETCKALGLDYIISKHPRDGSQWDDPNLINSSAFSVPDQMRSCSIVISRFSNISYEALTYGRPSIYYNPHREPMKTFNEDRSGAIMNVYDRAGLAEVLKRRMERPEFDLDGAREYMGRHCGPMDGDSIGRVARVIQGLVSRRLTNARTATELGRQIAGTGGGPLFTVLICTHNRARMLDQAIRSVIETTPADLPYEILIVDNASTDDTRAITQRYMDRHPVRYLYEEKLGLSTARNTGWQNANGKYVVFLDDDGEACPGWLRGFLDVFDAQPDAVAVGGRIEPRYEGSKPGWVQGVSERFYGEYDLGSEVIPADWVPGGNTAWRCDVIKTLGGFDSRFGRVGASPVMGSEESLLIKQAIARGGKIFYTPHAFMLHHITSAKLGFGWLARRHYGQGKTQMRWGLSFGRTWTRSGAARFAARQWRPMGRLVLRMVKHAALLRPYRVANIFFEFAHEWGKALEAARYAMRKVKPVSVATAPHEATDAVILIPNNDRSPIFYQDVRDFARARGARLVLLNFETPKWFNSLSPVKRDPALWENWKRLMPHLAMVLSISAEGERWARKFFIPPPGHLHFEFSHPSINTFVADVVPDAPRENRLILLTRFVRGEHKGCGEVTALIGEAMRGATLVLIVGTGDVPREAQAELRQACDRHGVRLEFLYRLSDRRKFMEIRRARLMLFPSLFEGFGLPPIEALYCNTPCIAFDLPVLRETCGDGLIYVPHGDWEAFRQAIARFLTAETSEKCALSGSVAQVARFEHQVCCMDRIVQRLMTSIPNDSPAGER